MAIWVVVPVDRPIDPETGCFVTCRQTEEWLESHYVTHVERRGESTGVERIFEFECYVDAYRFALAFPDSEIAAPYPTPGAHHFEIKRKQIKLEDPWM